MGNVSDGSCIGVDGVSVMVGMEVVAVLLMRLQPSLVCFLPSQRAEMLVTMVALSGT